MLNRCVLLDDVRCHNQQSCTPNQNIDTDSIEDGTQKQPRGEHNKSIVVDVVCREVDPYERAPVHARANMLDVPWGVLSISSGYEDTRPCTYRERHSFGARGYDGASKVH